MVSRLFGLRPGMFDIVVFDEASQLPVESALPALFRAKRFVVSGDEKQLPPTNFFNTRFGSDEEELNDDWLESDSGEMEDESRLQREEALNRREVKDCSDLLALAQTVLPTTTLEIHYRSKYRQLIAFSNSAFYSGRLNVPAQHPNRRFCAIDRSR
jgi:primosomal replication protein N''